MRSFGISTPRLSQHAGTFIDDTFARHEEIGLATISLVEMVYLSEKHRIPSNTLQTVMQIVADPAIGLRLINLDENIAQALATIPRAQVPDMPDRIIAATAVRHAIPCISRDGKIQLSQVPTIW